MSEIGFELQHLKRVSKIKHQILKGYLPPWAAILGVRHTTLCYFDCYSGPGRYELEGVAVPGSPTIALSAAIEFAHKYPNHKLILRLIESNPSQFAKLEDSLDALKPYPGNLDLKLRKGEALAEITKVLASVSVLPPSFFMVDPYGHPLPVTVLNKILRHAKSELLVNLMWWR